MISRRDFLISGGSAAIGVAAGALYFGKAGGGVPDLIVHNGLVYTSDRTMPKAEAFAVKGDRFLAVGSMMIFCTLPRQTPSELMLRE